MLKEDGSVIENVKDVKKKIGSGSSGNPAASYLHAGFFQKQAKVLQSQVPTEIDINRASMMLAMLQTV